jgi:hypothetical protein
MIATDTICAVSHGRVVVATWSKLRLSSRRRIAAPRSFLFGRHAPMHRCVTGPACASRPTRTSFLSPTRRVQRHPENAMPTSPSPSSALPQIILRRPLVGLSTAQAALDRDRDAIIGLIDDGTLRAFNIGTEIFTRSTVRIVASDIQRAQRGEPKPTEDFAATIAAIFPSAPTPRAGVVGTLKVALVARRLNVRSEHIYNLVEQGWLKLAPGHKPRTGPAGSPPLVFDSLVKFLHQRRIT